MYQLSIKMNEVGIYLSVFIYFLFLFKVFLLLDTIGCFNALRLSLRWRVARLCVNVDIL